jgi:hypothetical protein
MAIPFYIYDVAYTTIESKATSWASKVSPSAAVATPSSPSLQDGAVPAPSLIAQQQQAPRPRKVKPAQETKSAAPAAVVGAYPLF